MARLTTIMTPKWIPVMPNPLTIGSRMGVRIRIAGVVSMNMPTIRRKTLITSRTMTLLLKLARIQVLTFCGTCIRVKTLEKAMAAAIIKRMGV